MNKRQKAEALESGIRVIVNRHVEAGLREIHIEMSRGRGGQTSNKVVIARQGLHQLLKKQVPECEDELIAHFMRLGERTPEVIADRISTLLKDRLGAATRSIGAGIRGHAVSGFRRLSGHIESEVAMRKHSIADKVRVALAYQDSEKKRPLQNIWASLKDEAAKSPVRFTVAVAGALAGAALGGYFGLR